MNDRKIGVRGILCAVCAALLISKVVASPKAADLTGPDLTKGEAKTQGAEWNMGPTGIKGWVFCRGFDTSESRQIMVTEVEKGSPADGLLTTNDVILGVNGKLFESDARMMLGNAITAAEQKKNKGLLKLVCWNNGSKKDLTIPLKVMGSYSDKSPYDCPKAKLIVEQGCRAIMKRGLNAGEYKPGGEWSPSIVDNINALALLASGNPEYANTIKEYAHKLGPAELKLPFKEGMYAWTWSYANLFLSEYYLATKDDYVLPAIREIAITMSKGQGEVGNWGHGFRVPGNNGTLGGYGAVNQPGLTCWMSLVMAQKCGVNDPVVQMAIAKSHKFFGFYVGKGSVPYGDHPPYSVLHDDNGKSGSAATTFDLMGDSKSTQFFSHLATAAYAEKELGHTGNFFGFLWGALGANRGGQEAVSSYLKELRWYYDLARRWDGSFFTTHRDNYGWDMTGLFVLHYSLPLQKLYITGKGVSKENRLTGKELKDVLECGRGFTYGAVDHYYVAKSNEQLLKALGSWSPVVRKRAAKELATRKEDVVPQLISMLGSKDLNARYGACLGLQHLEKRAEPSMDALVRQLSEKDMWLRTQAAFALSCIGEPARKTVPELLKLATVVDKDDPRGMQCKYLSFALFKASFVDQVPRPTGLLAHSVEGVDKELLYPVLRRLLATDDGMTTFTVCSIFNTMGPEELKPLLPSIVKVAHDTAPSGEMFAHEIRENAFRFMAKNEITDGLPAFIEYFKTQNGWGQRTTKILPLLKEYGAAAKPILPELKELHKIWMEQESVRKQDNKKETKSGVAEDVIRAIEEAK